MLHNAEEVDNTNIPYAQRASDSERESIVQEDICIVNQAKENQTNKNEHDTSDPL